MPAPSSSPTAPSPGAPTPVPGGLAAPARRAVPDPLTAGPDWAAWTAYFDANVEARARLDALIDWDAPTPLAGGAVARWTASLQRFQLGESGDGAHLLGLLAQGGEHGILPAARAFVAEEGSHARLLLRLLERLGADPIGSHWSDAAFVAARRCMGVAMELSVIAVAEGVAVVYYGGLADGAPDPAVRAAARRILSDELAHLPFVASRIACDLRTWGPLRRGLLRAFWWAAGVGGTAVLLIDHSRVLQDCGLPRTAAVRATWSSVCGVRRRTYALGAAWRGARPAPRSR